MGELQAFARVYHPTVVQLWDDATRGMRNRPSITEHLATSGIRDHLAAHGMPICGMANLDVALHHDVPTRLRVNMNNPKWYAHACDAIGAMLPPGPPAQLTDRRGVSIADRSDFDIHNMGNIHVVRGGERYVDTRPWGPERALVVPPAYRSDKAATAEAAIAKGNEAVGAAVRQVLSQATDRRALKTELRNPVWARTLGRQFAGQFTAEIGAREGAGATPTLERALPTYTDSPLQPGAVDGAAIIDGIGAHMASMACDVYQEIRGPIRQGFRDVKTARGVATTLEPHVIDNFVARFTERAGLAANAAHIGVLLNAPHVYGGLPNGGAALIGCGTCAAGRAKAAAARAAGEPAAEKVVVTADELIEGHGGRHHHNKVPDLVGHHGGHHHHEKKDHHHHEKKDDYHHHHHGRRPDHVDSHGGHHRSPNLSASDPIECHGGQHHAKPASMSSGFIKSHGGQHREPYAHVGAQLPPLVSIRADVGVTTPPPKSAVPVEHLKSREDLEHTYMNGNRAAVQDVERAATAAGSRWIVAMQNLPIVSGDVGLVSGALGGGAADIHAALGSLDGRVAVGKHGTVVNLARGNLTFATNNQGDTDSIPMEKVYVWSAPAGKPSWMVIKTV